MYLVIAEVRTFDPGQPVRDVVAAMTALTADRAAADPVQHVRVRGADHGADVALFLLAGSLTEARSLALRTVRAAAGGLSGAVMRLSSPLPGAHAPGLPGP